MRCSDKCPFFWYDGHTCESGCIIDDGYSLSARTATVYRKILDMSHTGKYGCWLPYGLLKLMRSLYDRIDYVRRKKRFAPLIMCHDCHALERSKKGNLKKSARKLGWHLIKTNETESETILLCDSCFKKRNDN